MNLYIPDIYLQVPDNFKFIVDDNQNSGSWRCVKIYNGKKLHATFTLPGSKATVIQKAKKKLIFTMMIALLQEHKILKDDYVLYHRTKTWKNL